MRHTILLALLAVLVAPSAVAQQIFKCTEHGKTVFSDHPCGETARAPDLGRGDLALADHLGDGLFVDLEQSGGFGDVAGGHSAPFTARVGSGAHPT